MSATLSSAQNILNDSLAGDSRIIRKANWIKRTADYILDKRDNHSLTITDTTYMKRVPERLRLKTNINASGTFMIIRANRGDVSYETRLSAQNKYTLSLVACYRGIALGIALNPSHLIGNNKDYEFNINAYGNRIGGDISYQYANTYTGEAKRSEMTVDIPAGMVHQNMFIMNLYFVFNSRRFSYPAAFSQSWIQRKSAGSFMLGISYINGVIQSDKDDELGTTATHLHLRYGGIGAGYGYNLVLHNNWLIHLSSLPELLIHTHSRLFINNEEQKMPYRFPNIIVIGRIAVVHHFGKYFAGMSCIVNNMAIGDRDELHLLNTKWRGRLFFGVKI